MADIRINALATTASSTASDDFLAVDGSSQGTRKLNAYSPSFGGNATVGGTLNVTGKVAFGGTALGSAELTVRSDHLALGDGKRLYLWSSGNTYAPSIWANGNNITFGTNADTNNMVLDSGGNLTVSGSIQIPRQTSNFSPGSTIAAIYTKENSGGGTEDALIIRSDGVRIEKYDGTLQAEIFRSGGLYVGTTPADPGANNLSVQGNLTVSGGTVTSGTGTLTLNSSANTVVLQSAGTTALTLDSSQNATFAGKVAGSVASGGTTSVYGKATLASSSADNAIVWHGIGDQNSANRAGLVCYQSWNGTYTDYLAKITITQGGVGGLDNIKFLRSGGINLPNLPTSSSGLSSGDIWNDGGTLKIV